MVISLIKVSARYYPDCMRLSLLFLNLEKIVVGIGRGQNQES